MDINDLQLLPPYLDIEEYDNDVIIQPISSTLINDKDALLLHIKSGNEYLLTLKLRGSLSLITRKFQEFFKLSKEQQKLTGIHITRSKSADNNVKYHYNYFVDLIRLDNQKLKDTIDVNEKINHQETQQDSDTGEGCPATTSGVNELKKIVQGESAKISPALPATVSEVTISDSQVDETLIHTTTQVAYVPKQSEPIKASIEHQTVYEDALPVFQKLLKKEYGSYIDRSKPNDHIKTSRSNIRSKLLEPANLPDTKESLLNMLRLIGNKGYGYQWLSAEFKREYFVQVNI